MPGGRVIVAGSINMDVVARAARHPALGETVGGDALAFHPGGKGANQAVAAARLGADTTLIGALGIDAFGDDLEAFLRGEGVDTARVRRARGTPTGVALIVVAGGENTIVVVPGANGSVSPGDVAAIEPGPSDVLVAQLEIPLDAVAAFLERGRAAGATTILNVAPAARLPADVLAAASIVVVNETELASQAGRAPAPGEEAEAARAVRAAPAQVVVVTLGARGAIAVTPDGVEVAPGLAVEVVDPTGAGDCFAGALAARAAAGDAPAAALRYANAAAAICVGRAGAGPSMPTAQEVAASAPNLPA